MAHARPARRHAESSAAIISVAAGNRDIIFSGQEDFTVSVVVTLPNYFLAIMFWHYLRHNLIETAFCFWIYLLVTLMINLIFLLGDYQGQDILIHGHILP